MAKPTYPGPRKLPDALSQFRLQRAQDAPFQREGLRPDAEHRDLGLAAATGGRFGLKHIRAIAGFETTGWHWEITLKEGDALSQPAGVPHNVIARSADFEVLELNVPADYGTFDL